MSLVTTLKRRVTKPWERTRVTADRRVASARLEQGQIQAALGISQPQHSQCKTGTGVPGLCPSWGVKGLQWGWTGTPCAPTRPAAGRCSGEFPGPSSHSTCSACLAGPQHPPRWFPEGLPSPCQALTCCEIGVGGGSRFTFPSFTLSHHPGVCVLWPPPQEPAGKTGEHW